MIMKKTLQTFRYLFKGLARATVIGFLTILSIVAATDLIFYFTIQYNPIQQVVSLTVPFEAANSVFALLIGLVLFITNFKVALANGISRKTFFLANLPAAAMAAAAFSIFNLVVMIVHNLFWPINFISELAYPHINWVGLLVLQFALYLLMTIAGWFISLAYYRSSVPVRWAISLAPLMLYVLLQVINARSDGATLTLIEEYQRLSTSGPFITTIVWMIYSAILGGLVYLLIRRTPLRD
jgi:hypothetical protein